MRDTETPNSLIKIKSLDDLLRAVQQGTDKIGDAGVLWWRGQADCAWSLLPSMYRIDDWAVKENNTVLHFMRKAGVRHSKCPDFKDTASWLFLMQHYKLPTRIMDWTESALVALYFIVADTSKHDRPGFLWGLAPDKLNKVERGSEVIHGVQSRNIQPIFEEAFAAKKRGGVNKVMEVAAVAPDHNDIRQMVQLSAFTVHGAITPLNEHKEVGKFLVNFEVPVTAKKSLLSVLTTFGITRSYLFPDLENLSKDLKTLDFTVRE